MGDSLERLGMILALAAVYRQEALVFSAYGCGVFQYDRRLITDCFARYLQEDGR